MQNKSAVWLFTVLLAVATLYTFSKGWVASNFEQQARDYVIAEYGDSLEVLHPGDDKKVEHLLDSLQHIYLRDSGFVEVYPLMGYTYKQVKEQELNLGLDLQGGMHVTLEVSIGELILSLSDNSRNEDFLSAIRRAQELQREDNADFVTLFERAWTEQNSGIELWRIFNSPDNRDKFPAKSTNAEIFSTLREESEAAINNTENVIRKRIDQFGVAQPVVQKQAFSGRIMVELPGVKDRARVRKKLKSTANLEFWPTFTINEVVGNIIQADEAASKKLYPGYQRETADTTKVAEASADTTLVVDSAEDIALNGDSTKQSEIADLIGESNEDDTADQQDAPSNKADEKANPLTFKLKIGNWRGGPSCVGFAAPHDTAWINQILRMEEVKSVLPPDLMLLWAAKPEILEVTNTETDVTESVQALHLYAIQDVSGKRKAPLDGSAITNAGVGYDFNNPVVNMTMDAGVGAPKWAEMTRDAASRQNRAIAVVMDNFVYSAPSVNGEIAGGRSQITLGAGSTNKLLEEAEDLSQLLKAGSLPAPARILDEYTVGPTLGKENIEAGMLSFAIALAVILAYMMFYYKGAGVVSNIALIANLFFLVGALASIGAALTLPGIAGIVLTIGMAVDANVLIYERIREEMRHGKGLGAAVKDGYTKAYSAIVDANITTLLTAVILFAFGSGPIQGFATTLIIGIFTSLFSAIVITRLIFFHRLEKKKNITFSSKLTENWFTNVNFPFVKNRKTFYMISGVIVIAGIISLITRGVDYGVDFEGGTRVELSFDQAINRTVLESSLQEAFSDENGKGSPTIQAIGGDGRKWKVETDFMINSIADDRDEQFDLALKSGLSKVPAEYTISEKIKVDPSMSDDFRREAGQATFFALLVIFLYIFFRFKKWQYGLGALIAMMHDVIIVLALFSMFYGFLPFSMEIDQAFIAAILTVIGYSINDTVVVFDRIREYLVEFKKDDEQTVINKALNSTLSRTINTSLSTFIVLLTIFLLGGDAIKGFTFALMVGVVVGTYSSIFIATPSVIDFSKSARIDKK